MGQLVEAFGFGNDDVQVFMIEFLRDCAVENRLEIALDGGQRRAEIVRYVRDEIVLVLFHFI